MTHKSSSFSPLHLCLTPPYSGWTPNNINAMNTLLKSTFSGLQSFADNTGCVHSFSRCCLPNLRNHSKLRKKIELRAVHGHPRSSILVPIESAYATFY